MPCTAEGHHETPKLFRRGLERGRLFGAIASLDMPLLIGRKLCSIRFSSSVCLSGQHPAAHSAGSLCLLSQVPVKCRGDISRLALNPERLENPPKMPRRCCIRTQVTGFALGQLAFDLLKLDFDRGTSPDQAALGFRQTVGATQIGNMRLAKIAPASCPYASAVALKE